MSPSTRIAFLLMPIAVCLTGSMMAAAQIPEQPSQQDRQKIEDAIKALPPEHRKQVNDALTSMSPAERQALLDRAARDMKDYRPPLTQHIIEGDGVPASQFFNYVDVTRGPAKRLKLGPNSEQLLIAGRQLAPNLVLFRRRDSGAYSDQGIGNGILVSKSLVLTARHVAQEVKAHPDEYALVQLGREGRDLKASPDKHVLVREGPGKVSFLMPLEFVSNIDISVGAAESGDPDIALVKVRGGAQTTQPKLAEVAALRQEVASIGSSELEGLLPAMGTGIITTSVKTRELDPKLSLKRTVVGSSIRSYPGLSGAPVFRADGTIVAVILGGVKKYSQTGETRTQVPDGADWETFPDWTWATPLGHPLMRNIVAEIEKDR